MTMVKDILIKWLKDNGYDGLCNSFDCGCGLDDIVPCNSNCMDCVPAYVRHNYKSEETGEVGDYYFPEKETK